MKICIIGGGTAGWLAALWIVRSQPKLHEVTVIDSSKIDIIGAGEGTTGQFRKVLRMFNINEAEFMRECRATHKAAIRFENWTGNRSSYISPIDNTPTVLSDWDIMMIYHYLVNEGYNIHRATIGGMLAEHALSGYHKNCQESFSGYAFHFDGRLVGKYFKRLAAAECRTVDAVYKNANLDPITGRITSIELDTGEKIHADWFIDATGFARVLAPVVDAGWHSYRDWLTCDHAIPFFLPHKENSVIRPETGATALDAGWMWKIPTRDRYGCGYVYDSTVKTYDQALEELEKKLGQPVEPVKHITYNPGRLARPYCKNVMFIGLSGVFLEPLQATSIHGTIAQLHIFERLFLRPGKGPEGDFQNRRANQMVESIFEEFADLIQLHYRSGRTDTEFWRKQQNLPARPQVEYLKEAANRRWLCDADWNLGPGGAGYGVFIYPILAYKWVNPDNLKRFAPGGADIDNTYRNWIKHIDSIKNSALTHNQMLEAIESGQIKQLRQSNPSGTVPDHDANTVAMPRPKMQSQAPRGIHPLLRF